MANAQEGAQAARVKSSAGALVSERGAVLPARVGRRARSACLFFLALCHVFFVVQVNKRQRFHDKSDKDAAAMERKFNSLQNVLKDVSSATTSSSKMGVISSMDMLKMLPAPGGGAVDAPAPKPAVQDCGSSSDSEGSGRGDARLAVFGVQRAPKGKAKPGAGCRSPFQYHPLCSGGRAGPSPGNMSPYSFPRL